MSPCTIPYGSMVYILGVGFKVVDDTGGILRRAARRDDYYMDIMIASLKEVTNMGRMTIVEINIFEKG